MRAYYIIFSIISKEIPGTEIPGAQYLIIGVIEELSELSIVSPEFSPRNSNSACRGSL